LTEQNKTAVRDPQKHYLRDFAVNTIKTITMNWTYL